MTRLRSSGRRTGGVLALAALLAAGACLSGTPAQAATSGPAPLVKMQANRQVHPSDPVRLAVLRVTARKPITVAWGDGSTTRITGGCSAAVARRHPFKCAARVEHAYDRTGVFRISVSRAPYSAFRAVLHVKGATTAAEPAPPTAPAPPAAAPATTPGIGAGAPAAAWRVQMLDRVNALRRAAGAPPVSLCQPLVASAQDYATLMATSNYYGHVGPDGSQPWDRMSAHGYQWQGAAENIAAGFDDLDSVMKAWQASPGHYENIVNPAFVHVGFGSASKAGSTYGTYWVQHFGYGGSCG